MSLPSDTKKYEETSHENEEESLETTEYHSKTHSIVDMDQRAYIDGCLNYEGVHIDGCSQLYVGDIEIRFQNVVASQNSIKPENEYLVVVEEEIRSTSPSPLEIHEFGTRKK